MWNKLIWTDEKKTPVQTEYYFDFFLFVAFTVKYIYIYICKRYNKSIVAYLE